MISEKEYRELQQSFNLNKNTRWDDFYSMSPRDDVLYQLKYLLDEMERKEYAEKVTKELICKMIDLIQKDIKKHGLKPASNKDSPKTSVNFSMTLINQLKSQSPDVFQLCFLGFCYQRGLGIGVEHHTALQCFYEVLKLSKNFTFALHNIGFYCNGYIAQFQIAGSRGFNRINEDLAMKILSFTSTQNFIPTQFELTHLLYGQDGSFDETASGALGYLGCKIDSEQFSEKLKKCAADYEEFTKNGTQMPEKIASTNTCLFMLNPSLRNLICHYVGWDPKERVKH